MCLLCFEVLPVALVALHRLLLPLLGSGAGLRLDCCVCVCVCVCVCGVCKCHRRPNVCVTVIGDLMCKCVCVWCV
jgi:hypothetical protein